MRWFAVRSILTTFLAAVLPAVALAQAVPNPAGASALMVGAVPAAAPPVAAGPVALVAATPTTIAADFPLGVGDTIDVALVGRTDFNTRSRIGSDGAVLLPFIGAVSAVGKLPGQLAVEIANQLEKGGYFSKPLVRVDIVGVGSRNVTVLGSVATPGLLALDREYHLSEIVARVGGRTPGGVDYVVLTHPNGTSKNYKFNELATGGGDKDPIVASGDKIYVPAAENQSFYVTGQVKAPGAYPVVEGMTLRIALARAGGLTDQGSEKKVSVKRKGVDLKDVKLDVTTLEAGDIVTVGERLF